MTSTAIPNSEKKNIYFANLDGLRALAALMVVLSHIEYHKKIFALQKISWFDLQNFGKVGVTVFFALSGFLITYLLLEEKKSFTKIDLKAFYLRRVLRIWPLYFLIVLIGFFVYPAQGSLKALLLSVFLLPNLAFCLGLLPTIFDPIWSIGTEEQFYIFHPYIFRIKKLKHILYALLGLTVCMLMFNAFIRIHQYDSTTMQNLSQFLYFARYDDMLIGAMVAVLYFNTRYNSFKFKFQAAFNLLFNRFVQMGLIIIFSIFLSFFLKKEIPQGDIVFALLASLIIVNLCEQKTSLISLKNRGLAYCGKISYGIYLLHKYPLFFMLYLVKTYLVEQGSTVQNIVLYAGTIFLTILLASISYFGYERYFLRIKSRFQKLL